ncbi:MAG: site-specific DNA-methyltransferase [Tepidisphaeraceae bacterium]
MPTLNFKGKAVIETYHHTVPHHRLEFDEKLSLLPKGQKPALDGNLIIEGDNLLALKALLPTHAGKVKCVYIDPPYNTGNEGWVYNDNLTQPQFKEWIGKTVGKEGEDTTRHDKWCCMMYPRITLLRELLRDDGIMFVSIGVDELGALMELMSEIFLTELNRLAVFAWKSRAKPSNYGDAKTKPQPVAEFIVAYAKNADKAKFFRIASGEDRSYPHKTKEGRSYRLQTILKSNRGENERETMRFPIAGYTPPPDQRWQGGKRFIQDLYESGYIEFVDGTPFRRYYEDEEEDEHDPLYAFLPPDWTGTAESGKEELNRILGNQHGFDTVKPTPLLKRLIQATTKDDDIILDSYAGTGTTGHAALLANALDEGRRRFVLVQMKHDTKEQGGAHVNICETITRERLDRAIKGYKVQGSRSKEKIDPLGGSFTYVTVGDPLFGEYRDMGEKLPSFKEIAKYVFYTETSQEIDLKQVDEKTGFIGSTRAAGGTSYYLFYTPNRETDRELSSETLKALLKADKNKSWVIYCEKVWLHADQIRAFEAANGRRVRPMLVPFNLK